MYPTVAPRPETCNTCGQSPVHPRVMKVSRGTQVVTEAHWICSRCNNRFKIGTISIDSSEKKKN